MYSVHPIPSMQHTIMQLYSCDCTCTCSCIQHKKSEVIKFIKIHLYMYDVCVTVYLVRKFILQMKIHVNSCTCIQSFTVGLHSRDRTTFEDLKIHVQCSYPCVRHMSC